MRTYVNEIARMQANNSRMVMATNYGHESADVIKCLPVRVGDHLYEATR